MNSIIGFKSANLIGTIAISGLEGYHKTKRIARLFYAKPGVDQKEI